MKKSKICLLLLIFVSVTAISAFPQNMGLRTYVEVDHKGALIQTETRDHPDPTETPLMDLTQPGLKWNHPDNGLNWISRNVSVGDFGTQVFSVAELNNERIDFLSCYDEDPPTPIWQDLTIAGTDTGYMCDSARSRDYHVAMYHVNSPDLMNRVPYVQAYTSSSGTPLWTWNYESTINYGTRVSVDRDATIVAIGIYDNTIAKLELYFLDPDTGAEVGRFTHEQDGLRGWDLSADGSTLYFHDGTTVYIFDIATETIVFTTPTAGSFDSHCISGDGSKFAFGGFGTVKLWEKIGGTWMSYQYGTGSSNYCATMDFSDDGSTLGFATYYYNTSAKNIIYMMDVATKTITTQTTNTSNGALQDLPSCCAISHDGKYFAVGRWGDQLNANPEVQIFENHVGVVGSVNTRGSVFDIDISYDGQVVVSGGKAIHANISGNGGDVDCYDMGHEDLAMYGPPIIGKDVVVEAHTGPQWHYALMLSDSADPDGQHLDPWGTFYLAPFPSSILWVFPMGQTDINGVGSGQFTVCDDPRLVGTTVYFQAIFSEDGVDWELSTDYLTCTLLPK